MIGGRHCHSQRSFERVPDSGGSICGVGVSQATFRGNNTRIPPQRAVIYFPTINYRRVKKILKFSSPSIHKRLIGGELFARDELIMQFELLPEHIIENAVFRGFGTRASPPRKSFQGARESRDRATNRRALPKNITRGRLK